MVSTFCKEEEEEGERDVCHLHDAAVTSHSMTPYCDAMMLENCYNAMPHWNCSETRRCDYMMPQWYNNKTSKCCDIMTSQRCENVML